MLNWSLLSVLWTLFICSRSYAQERQGYLVAAPSLFRAGTEESVSVTIFNAKAETRVQVQLSVKGQVVAHGHSSVLDKGTINLKVPSGLRGQAHLKVWGNRHLTAGGYIFHNYTTVTVDSKGTAVFIQTDKPIYKPKHKVFINAYVINPDLRPVNEKVEAYVLDPKGSRIVQWKNLQSVCCGVVNMSFPLSDQPVFGEWFIFVEVQGHTYNKSFEVQKYVIPKFELVIDPPRYIHDLKSCEQATVRARYTFGKPVTGKLTVNMTVNGVGYYRHEMGHPVIKIMEIKGSANFSLCVRDMMPLDVAEHFRGSVSIWATVVSVDGTKQTTFDDSTPVHKQLIDIKYSKDTRKQFKPGLPYKGKLEVTYPDGSPADGVKVRVKAELTPKDNVYTTELISKGGLATFEIPSIPAAAQYVWLETKVTSIDDKTVGDQYLPSYLSISSWYSPSRCHIQIQSPSAPLMIGHEAELAIKSTCPCNFTLHYEVASRGNIVLSGQQLANVTAFHRGKRATVTFDKNIHTTPSSSGSGSQAEIDSCVSYLRFLVRHSMAPLSRLLVYYVRENGEGVTDSLQIPVQPSFQNQVSVSLSTNESMPGEPVTMRIHGQKGSCVCVATVDKSMYLIKPGFQMTTDKVFQELADFDLSDAFGVPKDDGHFWWPGLSSKRRRRSSVFPWHWDITKDARFAFTEAGLVVMTDMVSLNHRQSGGIYTDEAVPAFQPHTSAIVAATHARSPARAEKRKRTFFPETWVWHCVNISSESGHTELQLDVPDSITTWVTDAVSLSEGSGLGLAKRTELRVFKSFFVDFTLPYSLIRGEQTKVPLTVYSYLPTCSEVHVKISVPKGIKFVGHPGKHHLTRKKCVAPGEAAPTSIVLSFTELGTANITARAIAYSEASCCSDGFLSSRTSNDVDERRSPVGMDFVRRTVLVEPEGLPREYTYSVFFCPNERIHISTPNKYEYQYVKKPARMNHFQVAVKTHNDAHFALSPSPHDSAEMVEIVLGGRQNTRSWISIGKMGDPVSSVATPSILSWDEFRSFWISWKGGIVQVGHGLQPSNDSVILYWAGHGAGQVRHIGFSTGWGSVGEFKIWKKEDSEENHNEAFTLGVPHNVVPGSERATAFMIGDVMGPTLNNLDKLLRLPFGCGEQNMIHFAPNVFVLKYLQKTRQLSLDVESEATDYLLQGYQRQLTYKRQDGSYSAFGERDSSGSMWLTAFVLKSFAQSRSFIFIDPEELRSAKSWLIKHQHEDGSFPAMGRILNKDLQGGIHGKISLTAYVVAALLETGITTEEEKVAVTKAKDFLESNIYSADDPYTTALSAYALALLRSPYAPLALRRLNHMAITQDGLTHWSLTGSTMTDEDTFMGFNDGLSQSVVSAEVEMTAYGLLTYTLLGDVASALPVVKWLSKQRNALGGFSSTQDTCVALQSLSEYAILSYVGGVNLTISLASTNLDFQETFELNRDNKKLLQSAKIPSIPTGLFVSAKGEGCCLMQIDVSYNLPDPASKPAFYLKVDLKEAQERHLQVPPPSVRHNNPRPRSRADNRSELNRKRRAPVEDDDPAAHQDKMDLHVSLEVCARWLHSGSSNMAVIEVPMLSGFRADVESLERLLTDKRVGLKRYELSGRKVFFYFDEIPSQCITCVGFQAVREYIVGKTAPVPVKIYDYYEPAFEATRFYNVSESSPLARELCDGPTCNEVESSTNQWIGFVQGNHCNNVFGCMEEEQFERCTCYRDCGYDGEPVCGSDGQLYQNQCQMDVFACRNSTQIKQVPMSLCSHMVTTVEDQTPVANQQTEQPSVPVHTGEEDQVSIAEVSYYSYEYDTDSEPFLADVDTGDQLYLPVEAGMDSKIPTDIQLPTPDTRTSPER
ncbi:C3 and PZP-like alpha-2-macroglobulin domain-containing protein 8 isoform X1 [Boleophthalmus pectinirostris]|uniref:C3 and PZP-like alpha-2-macroglobulin domain-containing protein 8 isoform X1 n=1 Tax=Boleophthalmus pectinirostris TaxID=150288 RepID=UPI00242E49C2|nr:C3 and PZP-like alpha-2-macroglobulin domain-containing protein 8 isoform X1 [Boleophthalmus pectinirostris]